MSPTRITVTLLILLRCVALIAEEPWIVPADAPEVRGVVVDPEDKPVPGAVVRCDFDKIQRETDEAGRFSLRFSRPISRRLRVFRPDKSQLALSVHLHESQADPETGEFRIPLFPARKLTGLVRDARGNPIPGATVWCTLIGTQRITDLAETDRDGNFTLHHPANLALGLLAAQKSGFGIDYFVVNDPYPTEDGPKPEEKTARGEVNGTVNNGPFTITLTGAKTVRFKAVDVNDKPLEGIEFSVWSFRKGKHHFNPAWLDFIRQKTDASGIAVFDWLPDWTQEPVEFNGRLREPPNRWLPQTFQVDLQEPAEEVIAVFEPGVFVRGTVRLPDGEPAVNWSVVLDPIQGRWKNARTDRRGRYQFYAGQNQDFRISVRQRDDEITNPTTAPDGVAPTRFNLNSGETGLDGIDFPLRKPTRVFGRVIGNPPPGNPERRSRIHIVEGNPELLDSDDDNQAFWNSPYRCTQVDKDDTFECWLPSGTFRLYTEKRNSHRHDDAKTLEITDQPEIRIEFEVKQTAAYRDVTVRLERLEDSKSELQGATVLLFETIKKTGEDPYMILRNTDGKGTATFQVPGREMDVLVVTSDKRFGKYVKIAPENTEVTLRLEATGNISGTITDDRKNGAPLVGRRVESRPKMAWVLPPLTAVTDATGRFEISGVVPGTDYDLLLPLSPRDWPNATRAWRSLQTVKVESGKTVDVGTAACDPTLSGSNEFSYAFGEIYSSGEKRFDSLFRELSERAGKENKRLLVLFAENEYNSLYYRFTHYDLADLLYRDPVTAPLFEQFLFMGVPTDRQAQSDTASYGKAKTFVKRLGIDEETLEQPTLCVFDADGKLLHTDPMSGIMEYGPLQNGKPRISVNKAGLLEFLKRWSKSE